MLLYTFIFHSQRFINICTMKWKLLFKEYKSGLSMKRLSDKYKISVNKIRRQMIKNNIHIENNCLGEMIFTHEKTEYTSNDRPFCICDDKETTFSIYKCSKCNYENKIIKSSTGGGIRYVSQTGFWWK